MKTRERLLFMALGGLLVLAGMIVGQFVFSTAQAQDGAQDATFKTVKCERLEVGDSSNRQAVEIESLNGIGGIGISNKAGKLGALFTVGRHGSGSLNIYNQERTTVAEIGTDADGNGLIRTLNGAGKTTTSLSSDDGHNGHIQTCTNTGKVLTSLSATVNGNGMIETLSNKGKVLTSLTASDTGIDADAHGIISTRSNTGKKLVSIGSSDSGGSIGVNNTHGVKVVDIQANEHKDGVIGLFDRYGDFGWGKTGKQ